MEDVIMGKRALLEQIERNHALFDHLLELGDGSERQKDIVAHVTAWQRRLNVWLGAVARGEIPVDPEPGVTWRDMDSLNAMTEQQSHLSSWSLVQEQAAQAWHGFIGTLMQFSETQLNQEFPFAWGGLDKGELSRSLSSSCLAGPGYAHYQDHFYDLIQCIPVSRRFQPEPGTLAACVGTYVRAGRAPFTFTLHDGQLQVAYGGQLRVGAWADTTHVAFDELGTVTFSMDASMPAHVMEWWTWQFEREPSS
jgi:hypothetical protein